MALLYALSAAPGEPLPEDIWILDSLPGVYDRIHDSKIPAQSVVNVSAIFVVALFSLKPSHCCNRNLYLLASDSRYLSG